MYKFSMGQSVIIKTYDRWIGDYTCPAIITGISNVFLNGIPAYEIKTHSGEIFKCFSEKDIMKDDIAK